LRESLTIQRAEWAYQNRPARLRALVVANFDKLELLPMEPAQFGTPTEIAYPPPPAELQEFQMALERELMKMGL